MRPPLSSGRRTPSSGARILILPESKIGHSNGKERHMECKSRNMH